MGYRIQYPQGKKACRSGDFWRLPVMVALFFILFLVCVEQSRPEQTAMVREFLLPEPVCSAVDAMLEALREDEGISDVVTAFCRDLLSGE